MGGSGEWDCATWARHVKYGLLHVFIYQVNTLYMANFGGEKSINSVYKKEQIFIFRA